MNSARHVLRWAVPGWLAALFFFLFAAIRFILSGYTLTIEQFAQSNFTSILSLLTILAALGIPVGFLIYQLYFWLYWDTAFPLKNPEDRGSSVLKDSRLDYRRLVSRSLDEEIDQVQFRQLKIGPLNLPFKGRAIMQRYEHNWLLADFAWYRVIVLNKAQLLEDRAFFLEDIYHSLGTSLVALWVAFGGYIIYDISMHRQYIVEGHWVYIWAIPINLVVSAFLTVIMRSGRRNVLRTLIALKHDFITYFERFPANRRGEEPANSAGVSGE